MAVKAYEYFKQLPPWAKGTIIVGGGVVIFLIGDSIWNAVKQAKQNSANLVTASDAVNTLNQLSAQGENPTYPDTQFQSWANSLVAAMSGCATDTDAIETIFSSLNNDADVYKLIAIYGSQTISGCTLIFIPLSTSKTFSLPAAITQYVPASERTTLNGILAAKGIRFTFS